MKPLSPLFTDLYELTMAAGYFACNLNSPATFSLYTRAQARRGFFVAAGLEAVLDQLAGFRFAPEDLDYLEHSGLFRSDFLAHLEQLRFNGDVRAMPEGTIFFPYEPLLEVTAPMIQAQLLETYLINTLGLASMLATKAARCVHAAQGHRLIDFSLRRTQGLDAGLNAARSSYLAGFDATSNVLAGKRLGIPVAGTMAHSFVMAFDSEIEAFRAYARLFPERTILLIDTYDTLAGARKAARVAKEMQTQGRRLVGVRLDSGDLTALAAQVRQVLDAEDLKDVKIFASGGMDEYSLADAVAQAAPIDAYGVGTKVGVSADAPYLDMVYKLVHFQGRDVRKLSTGKSTLAGAKQVWRLTDAANRLTEDILSLQDERIEAASGLLQPVMQTGRRLYETPPLEEIRQSFTQNFKQLPDQYKLLEDPAVYPVRLSQALKSIQR
jgi:nicotinate phosphoribosyltransferase